MQGVEWSEELPVLQVKGLLATLGGHVVLKDINFDLRVGRFVGVIGPNGAGKTTLLRVILGLVKTFSGDVLLFGQPLSRAGSVRHAIGYVPQRTHFDRAFPFSVLDVVLTGRVGCTGPLRRLPREAKDEALEMLAKVGMESFANRPIGELSGGQQQRVFLARALCGHTRLLLLDEPNTGLDLPAQYQFYDLLHQLKEDGLAILAVSHDLTAIQRADELLCINRTMHIHGSPGEVMGSRQLAEAYQCEYELLLEPGKVGLHE